jgi:phosphopantothenoylcysteine decarboxylase
MSNVLLGVTGSVAAIRTPLLYQRLREAGHEVRIVATDAATYFFDFAALPPGTVIRDRDEWPGREQGHVYLRGEPVMHIELRRWAELFLVAPLDANTLAKLAGGLCDNCLTCVYRAWDWTRPLLLAPAMNTFMWENPHTLRHLRQLGGMIVSQHIPTALSVDDLIKWINAHAAGRCHIAGPISKELACGDTGIGAMAEVSDLVAIVATFLPR